MSKPVENEVKSGGLAQFCVEHREVTWLALIAVLVWGGLAYTRLGQQEDPTIPQRTAMLVTQFPGATASKVEELVSKPIERKISELKSIEEIKTTSRPGISTMTIKQLPAPTATIDQEWDKVRAKIQEVQLPEGTRTPWLNTDFGNTITLLFGLVSPPITDAECVARANLLRERLAELRKGASPTNHAAVAAFLPSMDENSMEVLRGRFEVAVRAAGLAKEVRTTQGHSFILIDLETSASRADLERFIAGFTRRLFGSDRELWHPDFTQPIVLMGDENPLPQIRASAPPRYSYRTLELLARDFEDELKQVRQRRQSHQGRHRAGSGVSAVFGCQSGRLRLDPGDGERLDCRSQRGHTRRDGANRGTQFPGPTLRRIQVGTGHARHSGRHGPRRRTGVSA